MKSFIRTLIFIFMGEEMRYKLINFSFAGGFATNEGSIFVDKHTIFPQLIENYRL